MAVYPAIFDINQPQKYDRMQVLIRILIVVILSLIPIIGAVTGLIWLGIPVLAAILISQKGAERYHAEAGEDMLKYQGYIIAAYAYLGLLTDKLPNEPVNEILRFDVQPTGTPSVGQALLRIILVIPHAIALWLLGFVAFILIIVAGIMILINESYPEGIYSFLRGYMRWYVRVLAYLGSLVDEYPPFALDTGNETMEQLPPAPAPSSQ